MKRILILLLALVMCLGLFGCGEAESAATVGSTTPQETESVLITEATEVTEATSAVTEPATEPATEPTETTATQPVHTHNWQTATCTQPKTCTDCGETSGYAAGHRYASGKCTVCGQADPSISQGPMVWIPTKGGTKYHSHSGCSNMDGPIGVSKSYAISQGFTACQKCY